MTDDIYMYTILAIIAIFIILAFALKLEKLVQIILWNYVLCLLLYTLWFCIDIFVANSPNSGFAITIADAKIWILLVLYAILFFVLIYRKSKIRMDFSSDPLIYKPLYIAFVPLAVVSMLVTIWIIVLWTDAFSLEMLSSISDFTNNEYLQKIILNFPYIILIYSICSLLAIVDIKISVKVKTE